jgi:DNA-binding transcriptional ArsR family regulator
MVHQQHVVFQALADPARCAMVQMLAAGECNVAELAEPFAMTLQGVRKHLAVLEGAKLIVTRRVGRERLCRLEPKRLKSAADWLGARATQWERRLDRLGAIVEEDER